MNNQKTYVLAITILALLPVTTATVNLDSVSYDPSVITAGDRVNLTVSLNEDILPKAVASGGSNLNVYLQADNRLTREHVVIEDNTDTPIYIPPGGQWNQRFQVRVMEDAPTGHYDFDVVMNVTDDDGTYTTTGSFAMPVDREGIDMNGHVTTTEPKDLRPGDDNAKLTIEWTNTGNKPVEDITITPVFPEHIQPSHSADESFFINRLNTGMTTEKRVSVDVDDLISPGRHTAFFKARYEDESGNTYEEDIPIPIRVEGRPDLTIRTKAVNVTGDSTNEVTVTVENTGTQDAETVSARTIIERSQPFSAADRSVYIGEIESGDRSTAVFDITMNDENKGRLHQLQVELRATGDSDEGDRSVYTWTENTKLRITGVATNWLPYLGVTGALLVITTYLYRRQSDD